MEKVLVTGGCGFIGSNFVRYMLSNRNYRVTNLDALTYAGNPENLADCEANPNYSFVKGRLEDAALVEGLCNAADAVVHFAAESHVDRSIADARPFVLSNVLGTQVLLDAVRKSGRVKRFVHVSTDEVYGSLESDAPAFAETDPLRPNSPYAASKAASDLLVRAAWKTYGLPVLVTRCSNNYGPYQFPEKLIPLMIANALADRPLPVYGDGGNIRDWIYVMDHCEGVLAVLERGKDGEVYNLGGECELTNLSVVKTILEILRKPESLIRFVKDRPGHDRRYAMDVTKIKRELGWWPKTDFATGIRDTITWYVDHRSWCDRIISGEYLKYYELQYGGRLEVAP